MLLATYPDQLRNAAVFYLGSTLITWHNAYALGQPVTVQMGYKVCNCMHIHYNPCLKMDAVLPSLGRQTYYNYNDNE